MWFFEKALESEFGITVKVSGGGSAREAVKVLRKAQKADPRYLGLYICVLGDEVAIATRKGAAVKENCHAEKK